VLAKCGQKGGPAYDPAKRHPRDMLDDRFFFEKVKAYGAIPILPGS
jgi:hypothetical protein